ncbi:MAG TPA: hypothetical protein VGH98_22660 [Gemmatimonadaceae bacterium]|jgi:hypothetical protein
MAGNVRVPVVAIPFANNNGATVLCDDGSVWDLLYSDDGSIAWNDLRNPLPGSAAAQRRTPEEKAEVRGVTAGG